MLPDIWVGQYGSVIFALSTRCTQPKENAGLGTAGKLSFWRLHTSLHQELRGSPTFLKTLIPEPLYHLHVLSFSKGSFLLQVLFAFFQLYTLFEGQPHAWGLQPCGLRGLSKQVQGVRASEGKTWCDKPQRAVVLRYAGGIQDIQGLHAKITVLLDSDYLWNTHRILNSLWNEKP